MRIELRLFSWRNILYSRLIKENDCTDMHLRVYGLALGHSLGVLYRNARFLNLLKSTDSFLVLISFK
jgi:hypothetical protein